MAEIARPLHGSVAGAVAPIYLLLFPIPIVCFFGALATDLAYSDGAFLMWLNFSEWLIAAGLVFGVLAALALLVEFIANPAIRRGRFGWLHLALFFGALVVGLLNALVHTQDGWTAVVPTGLTLSAVAVVLAVGAVATLPRIPVTWMTHRGIRA